MKDKKKHIPENEIWNIAYECCKAVEYLHHNNIIHRDIKTMNVFLTQARHVKVFLKYSIYLDNKTNNW